MIKGFPDYAPSSAKPWDCKTSGNQRVGAFRRLFALSVASIPARVSTGSHLPRACTTCSKRGFTGGLARYAWLRMVRNQETISQPFIVALMTDLLAPQRHESVLEVGTGLGYQTAVLAELAGHIWSVEIVEELASHAQMRLQQLGYATVDMRIGDGSRGWAEH